MKYRWVRRKVFMFRRFTINFAILSLVLDAAVTVLALASAVYLRPILPAIPSLIPAYTVHPSPYLYLIVPVLWVIVFTLASVYDPRRIYRVEDEFQNVTLATGFAALVFAGVLYLFSRDLSRWFFVLFVGIDLFLVLGWRAVARLAFQLGRRRSSQRRVLIVGAGNVGERVAGIIRTYRWTGLELVGYVDDNRSKQIHNIPILGDLDDARHIVQAQQIDDVVIAMPRRAYWRVNQLILDLHDLPVNVRIVPDYFSLALYRATVDDFGGLPLINLRDPALNDYQRLVKRLFDLCIATVLLLPVLPLILFIALAIRLSSPGPIIFRQKRVGENGRLFEMYKFRSMINGADQMQPALNQRDDNGRLIFKRVDDPRVTKVGRLLRRTSLDELPQLLNVLKGDMSLVGPRPELPWLVEEYEPWQRKRFAVPQGLTGWWQINGRSDKPMHLHTEEDLYYVQNYSLWMDIYILIKTLWVVMRGKGAY
jgi:exopolysaccharide biosynthesis polyprenyl glycosylphosphotransferase